ncbi:Hypothetical predicted protein, partial [Paramuricea clavata]
MTVLENWAVESNLALNETKTKQMLITTSKMFRVHGLDTVVPDIRVKAQTLEKVEEFKLLGTCSECEQTFAKTQLGVEPNESKLLGLKWEKDEDTLSVVFPSDPPATTKRGMLSKLARVYDPLGLASPITVSGKMVYRDVCDSKASLGCRTQWSKCSGVEYVGEENTL